MIRTLALAIAVWAMGCQQPVEPIDPLAPTRQIKIVAASQSAPNLMILVDTSASMNLPANLAHPDCPAGCGGTALCPTSCPTRLSEVVLGLGRFIDDRAGGLRMGLATFPSSPGLDACVATNGVRVPLTTAVRDNANTQFLAGGAIKTELAALTAAGTSPLAASLAFLGDYAPLRTPNPTRPRENFVLLITAGAADCSALNPPAAVGALRSKNIKTVVVGFGSEALTLDGRASLNALAAAGGLARQCPQGTNAECGAADGCELATRTCGRKFHTATIAQELTKVLLELSGNPEPPMGKLCEFRLDTVPSPLGRVRVLLDDVEIQGDDAAGGWRLASGVVTLKGDHCVKLEDSTPAEPVKVELQIFSAF